MHKFLFFINLAFGALNLHLGNPIAAMLNFVGVGLVFSSAFPDKS